MSFEKYVVLTAAAFTIAVHSMTIFRRIKTSLIKDSATAPSFWLSEGTKVAKVFAFEGVVWGMLIYLCYLQFFTIPRLQQQVALESQLAHQAKAESNYAVSQGPIEDSSEGLHSLLHNIQQFSLPSCAQVTNGPIVLKIINGSGTSDWNSVICTLRRQRDLRELLASESGKTVPELPTGTYCFASPVSSLFTTDLGNTSVDRYQQNGLGSALGFMHSMEIHLLQQGPELLLFMSESDAASIAKLSGQDVLKVTASSRPEGTMQSLVMIPFNRVVNRRSRFLQTSPNYQQEVIDVELR